MKKIALLLFILLASCSKNGEELPSTETLITNISPKRVKYGDTITITGKNLHKGINANFSYLNKAYINYNRTIQYWDFIYGSDIKATFKVPELVHEDILLTTSTDNKLNMKYHGVIKLKHDLWFNDYQVIDKNTAYAIDRGKLYKSTNGYYNWEDIYTAPEKHYISSIYYLDDTNIWISLIDDTYKGPYISMYHSSDGGKNFTFKYPIKGNYSIDSTTKIKYFSNNNGYFMTGNQEMFFVKNNNTPKNIYDHFPNLNSLPFGKIDVYDFTAINENLIFLASHNSPYLIKIDNGQVSYSQFQRQASAPQFIDNIGYVRVGDEIHKSVDYGNTWTKVYEGKFSGVRFLTKDIGILLIFGGWQIPHYFIRTDDGGRTWTENSYSNGKYIEPHADDSKNYSWLFYNNIKYIE